MNNLKPGAYMFADELRQAATEADLWAKRRDDLIFQCIALGWKHREVAEMVSTPDHPVTTNAISVRVTRAKQAARVAT